MAYEARTRSVLKACSLTCRAWASVSRRHLFRVWNVTFSTESRKHSTLEQILAFLQNYSVIAGSVMRLRIKMVRWESSLLNIRRQSVQKLDCPEEDLLPVLQAMPRLEDLELHDVVLSAKAEGMIDPVWTPIHLASLDLIYDRRGEPGDIPTSEVLRRILPLFGEVETLRVCDYMGRETLDTLDLPVIPSQTLRIKRFLQRNINGTTRATILEGLITSPMSQMLTQLILGDMRLSDLRLFQSLLETCAHTLTSLHFGLTELMYDNPRVDEIPAVLNLSCCQNLQNLGFSCTVDDVLFEATILTIAAFLMPIRPRPQQNFSGLTLRRLVLDIWATFAAPMEEFRDSLFVEALDVSIDSFTTLQEVALLFTTNLAVRDVLDDAAIAVLQQAFPRVYARGILKITDVTVSESIDFLRRWL
ncbi:hypothetical protein PsYK624_042440 [Phanerochaete sordida]|uniref:F-box domain-containing protein n=1 Tax=Phanerochaete sordida TaxID=48140 RepID=A0A9P3G4K1_9APHY|nr:hypothetical protein PsYK624_042440 [Phanerochaete sordida]